MTGHGAAQVQNVSQSSFDEGADDDGDGLPIAGVFVIAGVADASAGALDLVGFAAVLRAGLVTDFVGAAKAGAARCGC